MFFMFTKVVVGSTSGHGAVIMSDMITSGDYKFRTKHKKQLFEGNHKQTDLKEKDPRKRRPHWLRFVFI